MNADRFPTPIGARWSLPGVMLSLLVFVLAYTTSVSNASSDPRLSLVVSQTLLQQRTIKLNVHVESGAVANHPQVLEVNENYYYFFPIGTSVFATPFVWIANRLGKDMLLDQHDDWTQNLISALACALITLTLFHISRCYVGGTPNLVIVAISVLGSALISTLGTALWNLDFAILFVTLALLLVARDASGKSDGVRPGLLGVLLFSAFFCRPTTAPFIAVTLAYLLLTRRRAFIITAATSVALLLALQWFNQVKFGQNLFSNYYSLNRFEVHSRANPLGVTLYGLLASPSRGLLVYSPFFAVLPAAIARLFRDLRKEPLFWFSLLWFGLNIFAVSRSTRWWGGYSFGPRILADAIPALILITVLVWRQLASQPPSLFKKSAMTAYLLLGLAGVLINSYQGLENGQTARWNGPTAPDIDRHPEYLLDWTYPQFLATAESICARNREHMERGLARDAFDLSAYSLWDTISFISGYDEIVETHQPDLPRPLQAIAGKIRDQEMALRGVWHAIWLERIPGGPHQLFFPVVKRESTPLNAVFIGWSKAEEAYRWSECKRATIIFALQELDGRDGQFALELVADSLGEQTVTLSVNGTQIGTATFSPSPAQYEKKTLDFDADLLEPHGLNAIDFYLPGARQPDTKDLRRLALAFKSLRIYPRQTAR